jgi:ATP phosphoribosyltransferase regulatory subunit
MTLDPFASAQQRRAALTAIVEAEGFLPVNPPFLLPTDPYFELAGEAFGKNLLTSLGSDGAEYCLRPEFTIPIVAQYVRQGLVGTSAAYSYMGPVFRQAPDGPTEYVQAGVEFLGQENGDEALDEAFTFARRMLAVYGVEAPRVRLGGVALFEALLAGANMPEVWRPRIRARFGHPGAMGRLLDRLAEAHNGANGAGPALDVAALAESVAEQMQAAGFTVDAGRTPQEIAARHAEKQALAAAHVPLETVELLRRYLAIKDRAPAGLEAVEQLARGAGMRLVEPLVTLRRHVAMLRAVMPQAAVTFEASFSPRLDYYTGVVFEMQAADGAVLVSGGQYDRLLQRLGASQPVTAAGCAVWIDRLEEELLA